MTIISLTASPTAHAQPVTGTAGPYPVVMERDSSDPEHTVYRPANLAAVKGGSPFVAFGNGGCLNIGNLEKRTLSEVASYGYVVTAPGKIEPLPANFGPTNTGGVTITQSAPGQMKRAIDWAIKQATSGPWKGLVDTNRIAVMGASCGGLEAIDAGKDPRVRTVLVFDSGILRGPMPHLPNGAPFPKFNLPATEADLALLHTPVIYVIGGFKDIAYKASEADFAEIQRVPLFNANIDTGHQGTFQQSHGGAMAAVGIAWLNWWLKGDARSGQDFEGAQCGLCINPAWTVKKKNIT